MTLTDRCIEPDDRGVTHVLRLSAEEAFPQNPVSFTFDRAHVEIEADRFVITSAEQRMSVIFAVTPPSPVAAAAREIPAAPGHDALLLRGHWLSSRTVEPGRSIAAIERSPHVAALCCDASLSDDTCEPEPSGS